MIRNIIRWGVLVATVGLGACEKQLVVTNPNNPETARVLASPLDAEALIGSYYKRAHDGLYRNLGNFHGMANVMSFQNYSSLANNCQNSRYAFTGSTNSNAPGNTCQGEQQRVYFIESEVDRVASNVLAKMDGGLSLGSAAQDLRARAFAEFLRGFSLGYLALFYDSAAVVSAGTSAIDGGALLPYTEVMDSALAALQRSIDATNPTPAATGLNGFPLPNSWLPTPTSLTAVEFTKLVKSYRARFRATVGRTAIERQAANWPAIIADAQAGITADHLNTTNSVNGPFYTWASQYETYGLWHQMTPFIIGMGDVSGTYKAWLAQAIGERGAGGQFFFMDSPDQRLPQGSTRAAQQADFAITSCQASLTVCKRYFVNRPSGNDQAAGSGWGWSQYDFVRFHAWKVSGSAGTGQNGDLPFFTKTELDMIQAEGKMRLAVPDYAGALALINLSRVAKGGLPPLVAADNTTPVPGGAACVPQIPVAPFTGQTACGTMWEAMKWEKRVETAYTHFAAWWLDSRGWNDLAKDLPLFWAVPYQDLLARGNNAIYGAGIGTGNSPNSFQPTVGTYGW